MKRESKNLYKDIIKRKNFVKQEIRGLILKSIFQNCYTANEQRAYYQLLINKLKKKSKISAQRKKCVISGQSKGIFMPFEINRHVLKRFNNLGCVNGITTKKW